MSAGSDERSEDALQTADARGLTRCREALRDAVAIRSSLGFMLMRMAVVKDKQDAYDVAQGEFNAIRPALERFDAWTASTDARATLSGATPPTSVQKDLHETQDSVRASSLGARQADALADWGDFLRIRHELIHRWTAEGKTSEQMAHIFSMDPMQVTLIAMTPLLGPRNTDPRWSAGTEVVSTDAIRNTNATRDRRGEGAHG